MKMKVWILITIVQGFPIMDGDQFKTKDECEKRIIELKKQHKDAHYECKDYMIIEDNPNASVR